MGLFRRATVAGLALTTTAIMIAGPAFAAAPANDTYAGRTVVDAGSLPFKEIIDTTQATSDADDDELHAQCPDAPAVEASVWYEITAPSDGSMVADVSASDYAAGVFVATGSPGNFTLVTCEPFGAIFPTTAGETYTILAFDSEPAAGNGGQLAIAIAQAPPPPIVELTVNKFGSFDAQTGSATIRGTVTCTGAAEFTELDAFVRQPVGRFAVSGFGFTDFACDGTTHPFAVEVFPDNGKFAGGKAASVTFAFACGQFQCGESFVERTVLLRGK